MSEQFLKRAAAAVLAATAVIAPAQAYIDPGAGSLILQGVIGAVAGGLFVLRAYWARLMSFLPGARRGESRTNASADGASGRE